jgi:predicted AlkP superfamily pyrophosphatase or phosphodiesterase
MRAIFSLLALSFISLPGFSQQTNANPPRLVVGIVVDQMRFDYLYKYQDHYGDGGFKRLVREGFNYKNTHFDYVPTVTAAGHASIYTGTTPEVHGIVGNSWYDRASKKGVSNVGDSKVKIVGSVVENPYGRSPQNLLSSTITDQLRAGSNFRSKVISVSLKDRGAILPGGRTANGAYWHDWESSPGYFVSSSYYMEKLPSWVQDFNKRELTDSYLSQTWNTLLPISEYDESAPDDNPHERLLRGKDSPTFPYDLEAMRKLYNGETTFYQVLWGTPFGNTIVKDFALEALKNEGLGKDIYTDMLCVSFSTPDVVGHTFGPQSVEVQDIYLRLDRDIENLLNTLDQEVGKNNYMVFLTSDHGAMPVVSYLHANKMQAGLAVIPKFKQDLSFYLNQRYGAFEWIAEFGYEQIYLDRKLIAEKKLSLPDVQQAVADFMQQQPGVRFALTAQNLQDNNFDEGIPALVHNGFHPARSGDVMLVYEPGFTATSDFRTPVSEVQGTGHGSGYAYDTHVPMLWFGKGIRKGETSRKVHPSDIAPTLSMMLNLQMPSGASGEPLSELLDK